MTTWPVVERLDPLKDVLLGFVPREVTAVVDTFERIRKKLSTTALSQQLPLRLIELVITCS